MAPAREGFLCTCTSSIPIITPRRVGGGGVKQLVLSVRPSVRCLSTQKSGYLAIYRVKRLLNTTVTLK